MQTVKNKYGIEVKVQCTSCEYKEQTRNVGKRWCSNHQKEVCPGDCCGAWKMSRKLEQLGASKGTVKSREYLMSALRKAIEIS